MHSLDRSDALSNREFREVHKHVRAMILGLDQDVVSWLELNHAIDDLVERETAFGTAGRCWKEGQTFLYSLEYTFFRRESDELDGELNSVALSVVVYVNDERILIRRDIASIYAQRVYPDLVGAELTEDVLQDLRDDYLQEIRAFLDGGPEDAAHELSQTAKEGLGTPLAANPTAFQILHSVSYYAHAMWISHQSVDLQTRTVIVKWLTASEAVWLHNSRCLIQVIRIVHHLALDEFYSTLDSLRIGSTSTEIRQAFEDSRKSSWGVPRRRWTD